MHTKTNDALTGKSEAGYKFVNVAESLNPMNILVLGND